MSEIVFEHQAVVEIQVEPQRVAEPVIEPGGKGDAAVRIGFVVLDVDADRRPDRNVGIEVRTEVERFLDQDIDRNADIALNRDRRHAELDLEQVPDYGALEEHTAADAVAGDILFLGRLLAAAFLFLGLPDVELSDLGTKDPFRLLEMRAAMHRLAMGKTWGKEDAGNYEATEQVHAGAATRSPGGTQRGDARRLPSFVDETTASRAELPTIPDWKADSVFRVLRNAHGPLKPRCRCCKDGAVIRRAGPLKLALVGDSFDLLDGAKWAALIAAAIALAATAVFSKVGSIALAELFWESEIVAIGSDVRVFEQSGWRVAEFSVTRVFKGSPTPLTVYYLAEPTWACDISTASVGERSIIFLKRIRTTSGEPVADYSPGASDEERAPVPLTIDDHPAYRISHSGRGRMPIEHLHRTESVRLVELDLPEPLKKVAFDVSRFGTTASVPLKAMESVLRNLPSEAPPPISTPTWAPFPPEQLRSIPEDEQ